MSLASLRRNGLIPWLCLATFLSSQYLYALRIPFINEDYSFLDVTRTSSLFSLWTGFGHSVGPWSRPWSQGFHYWLLERVLGTRVEGWHVVSFALGATALALYFELVRRLTGPRRAALAAACAAALAGWGLPMTWIAGVQDLWMLVFSLAALHAVMRGWPWLAALTLGLALLSKETAVVVPALATVSCLLVERRTLQQTWARCWALWVVLLGWMFLQFTSRAGGAHLAPGVSAGFLSPVAAMRNALLAIFNLDLRPNPEAGWGSAAALALLGWAPLAGLVLWGVEAQRSDRLARGGAAGDEPPQPYPAARIAGFGVCWAALGWTPLLMPSLHWHSYYFLFGSLGAWLALSVPLARSTRAALTAVALMVSLRAGRSTTVAHDWGEESYVRRAGAFLEVMRADLKRKVPAPAPQTRFYFRDVPSEVGFLVGDGPSLRVWYGDPTLEGRFYRDFRVRSAGAPPGEDRFFRYDSTTGWVEVALGGRGSPGALPTHPRWTEDHLQLSRTLAAGDDFLAASRGYTTLANAFPDSASYAYLAGLTLLAHGDSSAATEWLGRAASLPSADEEIRSVARAMGLRLRPPPGRHAR